MAVVVAMVVAGCSGGDDGVTTDNAAGRTENTEVADDGLAPSDIEAPAASGDGIVADIALSGDGNVSELDLVRFDGIEPDADLSELELLLYSGDAEPDSMQLYFDEEGLHTAIGVHPITPTEGGPVGLQFVENDEHGPLIELDLAPLPSAPGAFDATIAEMVAELEARAEAAGSTLTDLAATDDLDSLDPELAIVKFVAGLVDDGTTNDLESITNDPDDPFTDDEMAKLDAIVGSLDLLAMLPADSTGGPEGFATDAQPQGLVAHPVGLVRPATATAAATATASQPAHLRQAATCRQYPLSITSSSQLAAAMEIGVTSQRTEGGARDKLVKDVNALAGKTGALGIVGKLVGVVDTMYATMDLWFSADAGRYPSQLTKIEAGLTITEFNEDFTTDGSVASVSITAASTGFDGAAALSKVASSAANAIAGQVTGKAKAGVGKLDNLGEASVWAGSKLRDSITGALIKKGLAGNVSWCPQTWTVSDAASSTYVEISAVIGRLDVDKQALTYKPNMIGDDVLRVRAKSEAFFADSITADGDITTKRIKVTSTPEKIVVDRPGDVAQITTVLEYADTTTLNWDADQGRWADGTLDDTNDAGTRPLTTPTSYDAFPFLVTVSSTSETGLRKASNEPRVDIVEIDVKKLFVQPDPGRVAVERMLPFTATDADGKPVEVTWSATGGTISADGVYTAGDRPGTYKVTATAKSDPSLTETVVVEVVEAECVVGTWLLRSQPFLDQIGTASGQNAAISYRSGEYRLQINDDGSFTGFRDAWGFDIASSEGTINLTIDSVDPGEWSTTDDTITIVDFGGEATVTFSVNGQSVPFGGTQTVGSEAISGSGSYECTGSVLTATVDGIEAVFDRVG